MSWLGLLYGVLAFALGSALVIMWFWPRHDDDTAWTIKECEKFLEKAPDQRHGLYDGSNQKIIVWVVIIIVAIGTTLTKHDDHVEWNRYDD